VSYASEDREDIARPLAHLLDAAGLRVWFDEFSLRIGDSLSDTIALGLAQSRYGVVVVSPAFMSKKWPRNELAGLLAVEGNERGRILPIWHKVTAADVASFNPILADRYALTTALGLRDAARSISARVGEWAVPELRGSIGGLWVGQSGRLLLRPNSGTVLGDYDWYGSKWAGSLSGRLIDRVFRFAWSWSLDSRSGCGVFMERARKDRDGYHRCLTGAWWYGDAHVDDREVVQFLGSQLHEGWFSHSLGSAVEKQGLDFYPWSFVSERSYWPPIGDEDA
jgi:TIR domain